MGQGAKPPDRKSALSRCALGPWALVHSRHEQRHPAVQTSSPKDRVPDCRRSTALNAQTRQTELSLADAMHQLDAGDRDRRISESLEAWNHSNALLHAPMVLLNQVVQLLRRAQLRVRRDKPSSFSSRTAR